VLQEVVVAGAVSFLCGSELEDFSVLYFGFLSLFFNHFELADELFVRPDDDTRQELAKGGQEHGGWGFLDLCRCWYWYQEEKREFKFSYLLYLNRDRQTTRARDHLFALLALTSCRNRSGFEPDYEEPIEKVVQRFAAAIIREESSLKLVGYAGMV
jgi:hypothetical protein